MPVRLERIVLVAITPATGLQHIQVHIPALPMKVGMELIMDIRPAALATLLPLAAPLALPAMMGMRAEMMGEVETVAMMIDVIG